jgi:hypothetical protein
MDILKQTDLKELIETSREWCVSIYMPTHRFGREQQQDPIRFKNLVTRAEEKLLDSGLRRPEVLDLLRPAESLLEDKDFWQHQSDGLAVFLAPNFSQIYRLPSGFDELMVIGDNFQIKPLLPLLAENGQFYILALSLNEIRLFLGTRDTVNAIDLPDVPTSMQEALSMDDPEKHLDFHTGTKNPATSGGRPAMFHGQGVQADEQDKENILRYFQLVDKGLSKLFSGITIPMVLAGVDYLLPIYHQANTYPNLLEEGLKGNPEGLDGKKLHKSTWELVEPRFVKEQKEALEQFKQLHGQENDLASDDLKTVVKAANFGRVDTLIIPSGVQRWGYYDSQKNKVVLETEANSENEDLLDFAAAHTLFNSGKVFTVQPENLPGNGDLAAIMRYAV